MRLGQFPASQFAVVGSVMAIVSIIACERIATWLGHEKPFPHAYISKTAQHYPEFIIFRIGTISGAVANILANFVNYFWLMTIGYEAGFDIGKYRPQITVVMSTVGMMALFVSTATIDTGIMDETLHGKAAGVFFVLTILSEVLNTFICWMMFRKVGRMMNRCSMYLKLVMVALFVIQAYVGIVSGAAGRLESAYGSDMDIFLEYTLAFSVLGYNLLMAYDVKGFKLTYKSRPIS